MNWKSKIKRWRQIGDGKVSNILFERGQKRRRTFRKSMKHFKKRCKYCSLPLELKWISMQASLWILLQASSYQYSPDYSTGPSDSPTEKPHSAQPNSRSSEKQNFQFVCAWSSYDSEAGVDFLSTELTVQKSTLGVASSTPTCCCSVQRRLCLQCKSFWPATCRSPTSQHEEK